MEVPIIIYSLLLIAILALNGTANFMLRGATFEGPGKYMPAPRASRQEEGATCSFVAKVGDILGPGEQLMLSRGHGKNALVGAVNATRGCGQELATGG